MKLFPIDLDPHHGKELVVPESDPLDACIRAFQEVLTTAHPSILSRHPVTDREVTAALLHMHLDACRDLLLIYDRLTFGAPLDRFDHNDETDEDDETDYDDIPF